VRGTSERLRGGAGAAWMSLHEHPFVRELAAGTLPPDRFRFYVEQNLMYLPEFARALAMGAAKARSLDEMSLFAATVTEVLSVEIPKNRELLERIDALSPATDGPAIMAPANLAYTRYLTSLAAAQGPTEIMAAIMPCAWSYGEIARDLGEVADHPVYREWVGFFAGDEYHHVVDELRTTFDEMAGEGDEAPLQEIFTTAVRLEYGFWEMAYRRAHWPDLMAA
jgi:thiaminase (transcriptional activator TenA)